MKSPKFWQKNFSILAILLSPFGAIYNLATQLRTNNKNPYIPNIQTICIGNITAGGSGKTPTAIAIAKLLQKQKKTVCFISKGYKGTINKKMPIIVDSKNHTAEQVGDEPLVLSQTAMCIVCDSRDKALIMAENLQIDIAILDDGFQDGSVQKSHNIIVVDAMQGFGNGKCIPAGPCREKIEPALMRATACVLIGEDIHNLQEFISQFIPVLSAKIKPKQILSKSGIFAFAGIGNPNKFYKSLEEIGFKSFARKSFKDHHKYLARDLNKMPNKRSPRFGTMQKSQSFAY